MVKLLTIGIPAYNMHDYLRYTLDSMICEDIMDELEVIIVDDGSVDDTADIAREYVKKYPNTFKLISKRNGGHGSALNAAISKATGKYFRPVDGDDWVDTQALKEVIFSLRKINSDMVLTNFRKVYEKSGKTINVHLNTVFNRAQVERGEADSIKKKGRTVCIYEKEYSFSRDVYDFYNQYLFHFISYKTQLLKDNKIRFTEHCFYDDMEYDLYPMRYVKTVTAIDRYLYQYRLEREGQSVDSKAFIKHRNDRFRIVENTTRFFIINREYFDWSVRAHLQDETIYRIRRQYDIYLMMDDAKAINKEMKRFDTMIQGIDGELYRLSGSEKIDELRYRGFSKKVIRKYQKIAKKEEEDKLKPKPKSWSIESDFPMHKEIFRRKLMKYSGLYMFDEEMVKIRKYKNSHLGERCFITCTGPSLTISDLELLKNENTIGVNSITEAYHHTTWRPTFYVLVDIFAFKKYLSESEVMTGKLCKDTAFLHYRARPKMLWGNEVFCPISYENHQKKWMDHKKIKVSSDLSVCAYDCFTVTNMAIQIAMYMGFKEIYLIGADCNYTTSKIHFIEMPDDQKKISEGWLPNATELSIDGYREIKKYADKHGFRIYNATRGGMLEVFPRVNLDDLVEGP